MSGFIHPLRASTFGSVCFIHPLPLSGLSARRNGDCDPQRAQNDIQSFF